MLAVPEELRLLEAAVEVWCMRLVWLWPELEVRVTMTLVGGGLGDRRSLERDGVKTRTKWTYITIII